MSVPSGEPLEVEGDRPGRGLRVLMADDNAVVRASLRLLLRSQGCHVDEAVNGREAVELARRNAYDLLLLDVQMPDMDGLEAARSVAGMRPPHGAPRPRIFVMTAEIPNEERRSFADAGVEAVLEKPVRLGDLLGILRSHPSDIGEPCREEPFAWSR